jgi:hypothetical protein
MENDIYVVYLTTYIGTKLPPYYIGSTSLYNITHKNYIGSVNSKRYKNLFIEESKLNSHLFKTEIISTHKSRKDALEAELAEQIKRDVVKSPEYINLSFAKINGFFGMIGPRPSLTVETRNKLKQYCWVNNGVTNVKIKRLDLNKYLENGYLRGRTPISDTHRIKLQGKRSIEQCKNMKKPKTKDHISKLVAKHFKPVVMFGVQYNSQKNACESLEKSRCYIMARINDPLYEDCYILDCINSLHPRVSN